MVILAAVGVSFKDLSIYSWSLLVQESKNTTQPFIEIFRVGGTVNKSKSSLQFPQ